LDIGRDFIRGGESADLFHSELDMASAHFLDLDGAGTDGDLIGDTEDCCTAAIRTHFGAMRFTIAILSLAETIADSSGRANAQTRADLPLLRIADEQRQTPAAADSAEYNTAATCEASHHAADPAWAAEFRAVAAEVMRAADTADMDINN
jgi:hypothetical protein